MPRDIVPVLRSILAVEGLPEGLREDLEGYIKQAEWVPIEMMDAHAWRSILARIHPGLVDAPEGVREAVRQIWTARHEVAPSWDAAPLVALDGEEV